MTELERLQQEVRAKTERVGELETTLAALEEELRRLQGEVPADEVAALPEKPFYKRWAFWVPVGGITALISGIAVWKKRQR